MPSILGEEYAALRSSFRRSLRRIAELDGSHPLSWTPDLADALGPLALGDLIDAGPQPGLDHLGWVIAFEELGRTAAAVSAFSSVALGAMALHFQPAMTPEARQLRDAAFAGSARLALAYRETPPVTDSYATVVSDDADGLVLTGEKADVVGARAAQVLVVAAAGVDGPRLFLVDTTDDGVTIVPSPGVDDALDSSRARFDSARARAAADDGCAAALEQTLAFARLALAALAIGACDDMLELVVQYTASRNQFATPIGSFQAVSHRCGRARVQLEQMRGVTYRAAHEGDDGDSAEFAQSALVARLLCLDAYASIATSLVRAEGAIGVTWENILASHYRRAFWTRELLGGRASERNRLLAAIRHPG